VVFVIDGLERNNPRGGFTANLAEFLRKRAVLGLRYLEVPLMLKILFVSHDADLRAAASRALTRSGFQVTAASHAGHASLACAGERTFDVLVVENEMPDARGATIAARLRRYCPGLQVVRMCDAGTGDLGANVVVRPFTADDLIAAVLVAATPAVAA
jgi:DNA-binding response OmpR family regulator